MKALILVLSTLSALVCVLPWALQMEIQQGEELFHVIHSTAWQDTLVIVSALALPMILDAYLDHFLPRSLMLARWQMIISLFLPNFVMYLTVALPTSHQLELFVACIHAREILLLGALLHYCIYSNDKNFLCIVLITVLCSVGIALSAYCLYFPQLIALKITSTVLNWIAYIGMICISMHILIYLRMKNWYKTIYVSCLLAKLLRKGIAAAVFSNTAWAEQNTAFYVLLTLLNAMVVLIASMLPGRMAREEAQKAKLTLETKRNFVRYISHEIRTPLNTVYMGIQLAAGQLMQIPGTSLLLEIMGDIEDSCNMSIEILNDLLLFDKLESGGMELDCSVLQWGTFLSSVVKPFEVQARQCQIELRYLGDECMSPAAEMAMLRADANKLSQVIRNLVSNALKFTPPEGAVTVKSYLQSQIDRGDSGKVHCEKHIVRLEVTDTGPGISEENQKRLFNEIVQFNAADLQNGKGSGLGLWISKGIMDLHGGKIGVESSGIRGEGAMFFVEIDAVQLADAPYKTSVASDSEVNCGGSHVVNMQSVNPESRCLIVDDSKFNRKMMRKVLETYYGEVAEASDGMEAVQMVEDAMRRGANYDAIFMDSVMPRMGGIEATTIIRQIEYTGLIVGVTGNALPEDIAEFINSGANRVLTKPLQLQQVTDVVYELSVRCDSAAVPQNAGTFKVEDVV